MLVLAGSLLAGFTKPVPDDGMAARTRHFDNLNNYRYCGVFLFGGDPPYQGPLGSRVQLHRQNLGQGRFQRVERGVWCNGRIQKRPPVLVVRLDRVAGWEIARLQRHAGTVVCRGVIAEWFPLARRLDPEHSDIGRVPRLVVSRLVRPSAAMTLTERLGGYGRNSAHACFSSRDRRLGE